MQFEVRDPKNTKPYYQKFRKCLKNDLRLSNRLEALGLTKLLCDVMKYSFAGETCTPPKGTREILVNLIAPDHAICTVSKGGKSVI